MKNHKNFINMIWKFYETQDARRHGLPWRRAITPYKVLVSEIMLQQTQVDRVVPYFIAWIRRFPNFKKLSEAPQHEVLRSWKGLGYNSRALRLHKLAKLVAEKYGGRLPKNKKELEALPGVGPYTAGAVLAFAYTIPSPIIETNMRTVYLYHFFHNRTAVHDKEILEKIAESLSYLSTDSENKDRDVRHFYYALMDYGAFLKRSGVRLNSTSKHYAKQKKFQGSDRQLRGKILEVLLQKQSIQKSSLFKMFTESKNRITGIITTMEQEGFLVTDQRTVYLRM